jgi:hypothetical protein
MDPLLQASNEEYQQIADRKRPVEPEYPRNISDSGEYTMMGHLNQEFKGTKDNNYFNG